jgi:hypothetical protein
LASLPSSQHEAVDCPIRDAIVRRDRAVGLPSSDARKDLCLLRGGELGRCMGWVTRPAPRPKGRRRGSRWRCGEFRESLRNVVEIRWERTQKGSSYWYGLVDRFLVGSASSIQVSPRESTLVVPTLDARFLDQRPQRLIGDRADDADPLDARLAPLGIELIVPHRRGG